jgi:hypothetical protein
MTEKNDPQFITVDAEFAGAKLKLPLWAESKRVPLLCATNATNVQKGETYGAPVDAALKDLAAGNAQIAASFVDLLGEKMVEKLNNLPKLAEIEAKIAKEEAEKAAPVDAPPAEGAGETKDGEKPVVRSRRGRE